MLNALVHYLLSYVALLGIDIDISNVKLNSGMRYIAKLLLNSLWGKSARVYLLKKHNSYDFQGNLLKKMNLSNIKTSTQQTFQNGFPSLEMKKSY